MRAILILIALLAVPLPAAAQMGDMTAQEVANDSGLLPKRGQTPRRVQGPTITRLETTTGQTGYSFWGHPTANGAVFNLVVLLYSSGRDVTGATIDGVPVAGAFVPGGSAPSQRQAGGNVQIPVSAAQYATGLRQGLAVEITGLPNLCLIVPADYFRGYDARYRSVFCG